jgi:hypothetical protein
MITGLSLSKYCIKNNVCNDLKCCCHIVSSVRAPFRAPFKDFDKPLMALFTQRTNLLIYIFCLKITRTRILVSDKIDTPEWIS